MAMTMLGIGMELTLNRRHFSSITRILSVRYLVALIFSLAAWFLLPFDRALKKHWSSCSSHRWHPLIRSLRKNAG
ncbi:hypothetical protein LC724_25540 [Blautia sp. RD014234]|nr:hypothetical protein [Blautia parvula]